MIGNLNTIRNDGYRALSCALGAAGAVIFLRQLESGSGDYTQERQARLEENTVDVIAERLRKRNNRM